MEASRYGAVKNDDVKEGTGRRLLHTREFSRGGISQTESRLLSGIRDTVDGEEVIVEKKRGKERDEEEEQPRAKLKRY
jgi:hypothetical protein